MVTEPVSIAEAINKTLPELSPSGESTNKVPEKSFFDWRKIPPRFKGKTLDSFIPNGEDPRTRAMGALNSKKGLFLSGLPGTGKTHLAVACMSAFIESQDRVVTSQGPGGPIAKDINFEFLPSSEFFLLLKASFKNDTGEMEVLAKFSNVNVLLLDDVGSEKVTDWSRQMFYTLIDRRYRNMKQTIVTSNLSLQQLADTIDDRISSRIMEMCEVITLNGKDYRLRAG